VTQAKDWFLGDVVIIVFASPETWITTVMSEMRWRRFTLPHLPAEMPDPAAEEKDLEKVGKKLLATRGFAPLTCVRRGIGRVPG
jgi:hypothetical protein